LRKQTAGLADNDLLLFLRSAPVAATRTMEWGDFKQALVRLVTPPAHASSPGSVGDFAIGRIGGQETGALYLFFHNGAKWQRASLVPDDNWSVGYDGTQVRRGKVVIPSEESTVDVEFDHPFAAESGKSVFVKSLHVVNTVDEEKQLISAFVIEASLAGMTVALSTETPAASSYELHYEALLA
jgi:hypothetical protein